MSGKNPIQQVSLTQTLSTSSGGNNDATDLSAEAMMFDNALKNKDYESLLFLPPENLRISNAALDNLAKHGKIFPVDISQMLPSFVPEAQRLLKEHPDAPIYMVKGTISGSSPDSHKVQLMQSKEGKSYLLVAEDASTAVEYAHSKMWSDSEIESMTTDMSAFTMPAAMMKGVDRETIEKRYEAVLAHSRPNGADVTLRIGNVEMLPEITALQSKEGKNYIYLNSSTLYSEMQSDSDGDYQKFLEKIDREARRIQLGDVNPSGMVIASQANELLSNSHFTKMVVRGEPTEGLFPPQEIRISDAALQYAVRSGELIPHTLKELLPSAASDPAFRDADKHEIPVYEISFSMPGATMPQMQRMQTAEGNPYLLINSRYLPVSEAQVQKILPTDAQIDKAVKKRELVGPEDAFSLLPADMQSSTEVQNHFRQFLTAIDEVKKNKGIEDSHFLIDNSSSNALSYGHWSGPTGACSEMTKEKHAYAIIDKMFLVYGLSSDEHMNGLINHVLGHEGTHIERGHVSAKGELDGGKITNSRYQEMEAELGAAGPLGLISPENDIIFLKENLKSRAWDHVTEERQLPFDPMKVTPSAELSDEDAKTISQWLVDKHDSDNRHPSLWDQIQALRDESKWMKIYEERYHPADLPGRRAEEDWVIDQVMQDMTGHTQKPITNPAQDPDVRQELEAPSDKSGKDIKKPGNISRNSDPQAQADAVRAQLAQALAQPLDLPRAPDGRTGTAAGPKLS